MGRRKEYVAWDSGVQDGLRLARVEAFGALRRAAKHARDVEHLGKVDAAHRLAAIEIRHAIRAAISSLDAEAES